MNEALYQYMLEWDNQTDVRASSYAGIREHLGRLGLVATDAEIFAACLDNEFFAHMVPPNGDGQ